MRYEQGDIVIVPFPFSDLSSIKQRPVLVLSKNKDISSSEDVVTCGITSNLRNERHSILIDNSDLEKGSIPVESRIKVDKLFTLNKDLIRKKVARVKDNVFDKVRIEFCGLVE